MGIWVGRYAMVGGEVLEYGPGLVDQRFDRDDGTVRLLVLAEPIDARSAEFGGEVAEAAAALFGRETLSVTGGLLRALRQVHANLAEWNERSLREHQVAVGLTCVAVRGAEATIAQLGPGIVYVAADDDARRLSTEGLPATTPLGGTEAIEPRFTTAMLPDEHLLLVTSVAESLVGEAGIREALRAGPERALAEIFTRTRAVPDMVAILLAELDIDEETPTLSEPELLPDPAPSPVLDSGRVEREVASTSPAAVAGGWDNQRPRAMPTVRRPSRVAGSSPFPFRAIPPRATIPRAAGIAGGIAAAVLLVVLGWLLLPGLFGQDRESRLEDALAAANLQVANAERAESPDLKRAALITATEQLVRAGTVTSGDPRLLALEEEVREALAVLDAVVNVETLRPILQFAGNVTAPLDATSITFGGGFLWLVDSEQGRVLRVDPEGSFDPIEAYSSGRLYSGRTAAPPVAASWDEGGNRLLLIDDDRQLWSIVTNSEVAPTPLALRGADDLRSVAAIATYVDNLYVLDPDGGEVWRYLPAGDGFDSERAGLLGAIDLPDATHLVVDGDVFLQDGSALRRFQQGTERDSLLIGIDEPPLTPSAIVENGIRGLIFVADRGNGRIVVSDREGPFVSQYHHSGFADLRGLALSADGERLYVLTGDGIESFSVAVIAD